MISFLVNNRAVRMELAPEEIALDVLRRKLRLTGVKEGCREGDCGACTILLGTRRNSSVFYQAVNSCLLPAHFLEGRHVVTIEGLNGPGLNPIQQAFLDEGAVQCGFCTPGILLALTAYLLNDPEPAPARAVRAISGNICRCTGYIAIRRAVERFFRSAGKLSRKNRLEELIELGILPAWFHKVAGKLGKLPPPARGRHRNPPEKPVFVAGATDLFVHPPLEADSGKLVFLEEPLAKEKFAIRGGTLEIDGRVTVQELLESPEIKTFWPAIPGALELVSSVQIRNRATVAGNIVNASPIGDITIILLALGAEIVLSAGKESRRLPLEELFLDYKKLAKTPGEILSGIVIPLPEQESRFGFEKVSRRQHLDIASVNTAIQLTVREGVVCSARIAAGGVAPVPLLLRKASAALTGKTLDQKSLGKVAAEAAGEISPISDTRGSADYKRRLLRNLILTIFLELFPESVTPESLNKLLGFRKRPAFSLKSLLRRKK